jgi:hypothetical protein
MAVGAAPKAEAGVTLTRRRFLGTSATVVAAASCSIRELLGEDDLMSELTGVRSGQPAFAWIGGAYLRGHADEASEAVLVERLGLSGQRSRQEIFDHLARSIQDDARSGDLVIVRDWLLTRTEARLYALGSL